MPEEFPASQETDQSMLDREMRAADGQQRDLSGTKLLCEASGQRVQEFTVPSARQEHQM